MSAVNSPPGYEIICSASVGGKLILLNVKGTIRALIHLQQICRTGVDSAGDLWFDSGLFV